MALSSFKAGQDIREGGSARGRGGQERAIISTILVCPCALAGWFVPHPFVRWRSASRWWFLAGDATPMARRVFCVVVVGNGLVRCRSPTL